MKELYSAPEFKLILLNAQNILSESSEGDPEKDPASPDIWG